jgi:HPt (histidine-containing phosphotransfer) domain-containing protein
MTSAKEEAKEGVLKRIAAVKARFVAGLSARTDELSGLATQAAASDPDMAAGARDALRIGLHNLSGAAPTLGLHELGRRASELEADLMSQPAGRIDPAFAEALAIEIAALAELEA